MTDLEKPNGVSVTTALDYLEQVETELAGLYEKLADRFSGDQEARKLFSRLQSMESSHANLVRFQKRLVMNERRYFGNSSIDIYSIKRALALVKEISALDPVPSLEETLGLLLELDKFACDRCYREAIVQANPTIADIIYNLSSDDARAGQVLREFAAKHGINA